MTHTPITLVSPESTPSGDMPRVPLRRTLFNSKAPLDSSEYAVESTCDRRVEYIGTFPASMDITPVGATSYPEGNGLDGLRHQAQFLAAQDFTMNRLRWDDEELDAYYGPKLGFELSRIDGLDLGIHEAAKVLESIGITLMCPVIPQSLALAAA